MVILVYQRVLVLLVSPGVVGFLATCNQDLSATIGCWCTRTPLKIDTVCQ